MDLVSSLLGILQKPPIGDAIIEMMSFMAPIWIAIVVGGAGGLVMEALLAKLETWNSEAKLEITSADTISTLERRRRTCTGGYFEKDEGRIVLKDEGSQLGAPPSNLKMRMPKLKDSLSWGERKNQKISSEDNHILSSALSSLNK
nr:CWF19-like protein 2 isoform X1 [Ipomoea batatas]